MTVGATCYAIFLLPDSLLRLALWMLTHSIYRIRIEGCDNIPERRGALFVANHMSWVDALLLQASTDRPIRFLMYEPIRDLRTYAVVGLEAHVQWRHPEKGVMPADEFASLAEDSGLVVPIGRFALEAACTHGAAWNLSEHRVAVAVKVSGTQLQREGFLTDVRRALQQILGRQGVKDSQALQALRVKPRSRGIRRRCGACALGVRP